MVYVIPLYLFNRDKALLKAMSRNKYRLMLSHRIQNFTDLQHEDTIVILTIFGRPYILITDIAPEKFSYVRGLKLYMSFRGLDEISNWNGRGAIDNLTPERVPPRLLEVSPKISPDNTSRTSQLFLHKYYALYDPWRIQSRIIPA